VAYFGLGAGHASGISAVHAAGEPSGEPSDVTAEDVDFTESELHENVATSDAATKKAWRAVVIDVRD